MISSMILNSRAEPNEEIMKMIAHMLNIKIKLFNIDQKNYTVLTYGPEGNDNKLSIITSYLSKPQYSLLSSQTFE